MDPITIAGISVAAATVIGNIINAGSNRRTNRKNASTQETVNASNLAFAREQFNEQKYLNRNQYQLAAADMQAAGINPAMASGGVSLTSGSYASNQEAPTANPYVADFSPISDIASTIMSNYTNKSIAKGNNETQVQVAKINAKSQEKMNADRIASDERIANADRASREGISAKQLANQKAISDSSLSLQEKIAKANALREDYLARSSVDAQKVTIEKMVQEIYGKQVANEHNLLELYRTFRNGGKVDFGSSELGMLATAILELSNRTLSEFEMWIKGQSFADFKKWYLDNSVAHREPQNFSSWSDD